MLIFLFLARLFMNQDEHLIIGWHGFAFHQRQGECRDQRFDPFDVTHAPFEIAFSQVRIEACVAQTCMDSVLLEGSIDHQRSFGWESFCRLLENCLGACSAADMKQVDTYDGRYKGFNILG